MKNVKVIDPVTLGLSGVACNNASPSVLGSLVNVTSFEQFFLTVRIVQTPAVNIHTGQFRIAIVSQTPVDLVGGSTTTLYAARLGTLAGWLSSTGANNPYGTPPGGVIANLDAHIDLFWSRTGDNNFFVYGGDGPQADVFYHRLRIFVSGSPILAGEGFTVTAALGGA